MKELDKKNIISKPNQSLQYNPIRKEEKKESNPKDNININPEINNNINNNISISMNSINNINTNSSISNTIKKKSNNSLSTKEPIKNNKKTKINKFVMKNCIINMKKLNLILNSKHQIYNEKISHLFKEIREKIYSKDNTIRKIHSNK